MKIFSLIGKCRGVDIALCEKIKKIKKELNLTTDQFKNAEIIIFARNERTYIKNSGFINFTSHATPVFCGDFKTLKENHLSSGYIYV